MKRNVIYILIAFITSSTLFLRCSKDDPKPTTGKLSGTVTSVQTGEGLENVHVIVFNADDNSPDGTTFTTDASGNYSGKVKAGNYFLKFYKQGYDPVPPVGLEAVAFSVQNGGAVDQPAQMYQSLVTDGGFITGKVALNSEGVGGVLMVAESHTHDRAYSSVSDKDGNYAIYNVPPGGYSVYALVAGYNSEPMGATVAADLETGGINVSLLSGSMGTLNGNVRNLATGNKDVDVTLVHYLTKETIPGLTTTSANLAYTIGNIPDGVYIARATYKNDQRVMDPDRIAKFGEPQVTFSNGNAIELTFDITNSVTVNSPTNEASTNQPIEINSTTPTFQWAGYSSTSDYVVEVIDATTGAVVWGGFDKTGDLPSKNIVIPSAQTSVTFNSDGNASIPQLVVGKVYRWRVFASKNDQNSATGWTLISASEDQMGLIKIVP